MDRISYTKHKIRECVQDVVDNRGKNPPAYFESEKYPVIDNYLIQNKLYPELNEVRRYIDQEIHDNFLRDYLEKDDVIVTLVGNGICKASLAPSSGVVIIQNTVGLKTNEKLDSKFLYYYFLLNQKYLVKLDRGSSQPSVNKNDLLDFEIRVPNIEVQQSISDVLSVLDEKIELNQRINAELEAMAKTLYDYWFVQFDFPFDFAQGKPDKDGKPYKSSGGEMAWNEQLKREIPEGWEVAKLDKHLTSSRGVSYSSKNLADAGTPMVNLNSFNIDSTYKTEGIKFFVGDYKESKVLRPFDLVMCNTQQTALDPTKDIIGKSLLIPDIFEGDIVSSHHVTTVSVKKKNLKYYLNSLFNSEYFHRYISGYATGTNILGLNFDGVLTHLSPIPSDDLLEEFAAIVANVEKKKANIIKENQTLAELRDWLLPMLMNGQVRMGSTPSEEKL
jgi:type I restriction enzyme, S subunit